MAMALGLTLEFVRPSWASVLFQPMRLDFTGISATLTAFVAALALHEFGHFAAAVFMHFEILGVSLGPLRITRLHGKSTVQFSAKTLFTGSVSAVPRNLESWRIQMLVVVAAGPAATLVSGIAAAWALHYIPAGGWVHFMLGAAVGLSFLIFVLGFIPNGARAQIRSDAQLFYSLLCKPPEAHEIYSYHLLMRLKISGIRPCDYPDDLIRSLAVPWTRPDMSLLCADAIIQWAIDRGNVETADAWDRHSMELSAHCNHRLQNLALAKSACYDILLRADFETAKRKFAKVDFESIVPSCLQYRVRAAYHATEGNIPAALAAISRAQDSFPRPLPHYKFEELLLNRMSAAIARAVNRQPENLHQNER
jgi:hypothetical protein